MLEDPKFTWLSGGLGMFRVYIGFGDVWGLGFGGLGL